MARPYDPPPPTPCRDARAAGAKAGSAARRAPHGAELDQLLADRRQIRAGRQGIVASRLPATSRHAQLDLERGDRVEAAPARRPATHRARPRSPARAVPPDSCQLAPASKLTDNAARRQPAFSPAAATWSSGFVSTPSPRAGRAAAMIVGPSGSRLADGAPGSPRGPAGARRRQRAPAPASSSSRPASSARPARRPASPSITTWLPGRIAGRTPVEHRLAGDPAGPKRGQPVIGERLRARGVEHGRQRRRSTLRRCFASPAPGRSDSRAAAS